MAQFRFVMRSGPTIGKVYPLEADEIFIGRDATNKVAINDAEVSRRHARMELRGTAYVLQDLGSTNGTFVNGTRVSGMQVLNPGDTVSFGEGIVLAYESVMDMNATVLSNKPAQTAVQRPTPAPVSAPAPTPPPVYKPAPVPAYSGQVPAGPVPMPPPAATRKKKGGSKLVIIIIAIIVLCLILGCVAVLFYVDADKTGARWCTFPIISTITKIAGMCK
jgi:pSer/pThr/pTyr-binding forkhead associated (FHA) protein